MGTAEIRETHSAHHLGLIQTAYGVALILGLEEVAESLYGALVPGDLRFLLLKLAVAVTLVLLGLRLFAAVTNLRRYLARGEDQRSQRLAAALHVPILMVHAFLFFFLCKLDHDNSAETEFFDSLPLMLLLYCLLLTINAAWLLGMFVSLKRDVAKTALTWAGLNLSTVVLVVIIVMAKTAFGFSDLHCFLIVVAVLVIMSLADLLSTAEAYFSVPREEAADNSG